MHAHVQHIETMYFSQILTIIQDVLGTYGQKIKTWFNDTLECDYGYAMCGDVHSADLSLQL